MGVSCFLPRRGRRIFCGRLVESRLLRRWWTLFLAVESWRPWFFFFFFFFFFFLFSLFLPFCRLLFFRHDIEVLFPRGAERTLLAHFLQSDSCGRSMSLMVAVGVELTFAPDHVPRSFCFGRLRTGFLYLRAEDNFKTKVLSKTVAEDSAAGRKVSTCIPFSALFFLKLTRSTLPVSPPLLPCDQLTSSNR